MGIQNKNTEREGLNIKKKCKETKTVKKQTRCFNF